MRLRWRAFCLGYKPCVRRSSASTRPRTLCLRGQRHRRRCPPLARRALAPLVAQLRQLQAQIKAIEVELLAWHRATDASRRLETIPGVGFITATAMVSARSRRWATDMCAPSSSSAQPRSCDTPGARTPRAPSGSMRCWRDVPHASSRLHSLTRRRGSSGRFSCAVRRIALRHLQRSRQIVALPNGRTARSKVWQGQ